MEACSYYKKSETLHTAIYMYRKLNFWVINGKNTAYTKTQGSTHCHKYTVND